MVKETFIFTCPHCGETRMANIDDNPSNFCGWCAKGIVNAFEGAQEKAKTASKTRLELVAKIETLLRESDLTFIEAISIIKRLQAILNEKEHNLLNAASIQEAFEAPRSR